MLSQVWYFTLTHKALSVNCASTGCRIKHCFMKTTIRTIKGLLIFNCEPLQDNKHLGFGKDTIM